MQIEQIDLTTYPDKALALIASFVCGYRAAPPAKRCGACSPCVAKRLVRQRRDQQADLFGATA